MAEYKVVDAEKLDADLSSVADAIRTKGGTSESLTFPQGFVDAVDAIESGGGGDNYKNIIQEALYNLEGSSNYNRLAVFGGTSITDVSMFDFSNVKTFQAAFSSCKQLVKVVVDVISANTLTHLCAGCGVLKTVVIKNMTPKVTSIHSAFNGCAALESIETLDVGGCSSLGTGNSNYLFGNCTSLKEIRFVSECIKYSIWFGDSPLLSAESIQSIIDGLATVETAQTLTLHADVKAKLTETQIATITSKNWNLA